jgi:hypothetical protein
VRQQLATGVQVHIHQSREGSLCSDSYLMEEEGRGGGMVGVEELERL